MQNSMCCLILLSTVLLCSTIIADDDGQQPIPEQTSEIPVDVPLVATMDPPPEPPLIVANSTLTAAMVVPAEKTPTVGNQTAEVGANATQKLANCLLKQGTSQVQIVNDTELVQLLQANPNVTGKDVAAHCLCVLFYSKHCTFSSLAAPHFNALPRAFPDLRMVAINAVAYHMFNTQNGIVGVPSLLLLHNGKIIDKFNESDYTLEQFSRFITKNTGIAAAEKSFVMSSDFAGPVASSPTKETDVLLVASWCFILFCAVYYFSRSYCWRWVVEFVQRNWRESAAHAQHEHVE